MTREPGRRATVEAALRRGGARVRLTACKVMAQRVSQPERRTLYLLDALSAALALNDGREMTEIATLWESAGGALESPGFVPTLQAMLDANFVLEAVHVAHAETVRWPCARAFYLEGRCLARGGEELRPRALASFATARGRAENEGDARLAAAARARRVELLAAREETLDRALDEAHDLRSDEPRRGRLRRRRVIAPDPRGASSAPARRPLARAGAEHPDPRERGLGARHPIGTARRSPESRPAAALLCLGGRTRAHGPTHSVGSRPSARSRTLPARPRSAANRTPLKGRRASEGDDASPSRARGRARGPQGAWPSTPPRRA